MTGLFGGAFDPPHNGHVAVARAALERLPIDDLHVLVSVAPGHRHVVAPPAVRLRLARAAFVDLPRTTVELDEHARTVDTLVARRWRDPVVVIGADQWRDFGEWKQPERVLELARVAIATRPDVPVAVRPEHRDRVLVLEVDPVPISSSEVRERVRAGLPIDDAVPPAVARLVTELRLYRDAVRP